MIDYKELPKDGNKFEQLVREILLFQGLSPHWTGKGPDGGRDIIVEETSKGIIKSFKRKWLVQCKHFAHSESSVGVSKIPSVVDDCKRVGANGYLLACSTQPSSETINKLSEIENNIQNNLVTSYWDSVHIEKLLMQPKGFGLSHIFFPKSMSDTPWKVYNRNAPNRWAAHYKEYFMILTSRDAVSFPSLDEVELIIEKIEQIKPKKDDEWFRPRAIYFDNKNENFHVFVDYLISERNSPSLSPKDVQEILNDWQGLHIEDGCMWYSTAWDVKLVKSNIWSDHFQMDHSRYYEEFYSDYESGSFRGDTIGDLARHNHWF